MPKTAALPATDARDVAAALQLSIGLYFRAMRQKRVEAGPGTLTLPESAALSRLARYGPTTSADMARAEQISAQSMGATLAALEDRGLIARRPDPADGRRAVVEATEAGVDVLRNRRAEQADQMVAALIRDFDESEREQLLAAAPLIERLAQCV